MSALDIFKVHVRAKRFFDSPIHEYMLKRYLSIFQCYASPYSQAFDKNGDGKLTKAEIKEGCKKLNSKMTDAEIDQFIKKYDVNGDGKVCYCVRSISNPTFIFSLYKLVAVFHVTLCAQIDYKEFVKSFK